mmetsp:Transcript_17696/g.36245  ORF Transcript_17696/g.36245 Transcript_17696/m.36245 type:complete len:665 (+) Transcript_17696:561-2555(+)
MTSLEPTTNDTSLGDRSPVACLHAEAQQQAAGEKAPAQESPERSSSDNGTEEASGAGGMFPGAGDDRELLDALLNDYGEKDDMHLNFTDLLGFDQMPSPHDVSALDEDDCSPAFMQQQQRTPDISPSKSDISAEGTPLRRYPPASAYAPPVHGDYLNNGGSGMHDSLHHPHQHQFHNQHPHIPDFSESTGHGTGSASGPAGQVKLKFREYSRPVPASYYKSHSFGASAAAGGGYGRKDSMSGSLGGSGCFDQDFLQSSPDQSGHSMMSSQERETLQGQPPSRSLSCPESHMSGQDIFSSYDDGHQFQAPQQQPQQQQHPSSYAGMYAQQQQPEYQHQHQHQQRAHVTTGYQVYDEGIHRDQRRAQQPPLFAPREIAPNEIIHTGSVISGGGMGRAKQGANGAAAIRGPPLHKSKSASAALVAGEKSGCGASGSKGQASAKKAGSGPALKKAPSKRSSKYRGVTKHRRSGRWEAHIWVRETGKQVYLGGYELEEHAAEAYDVAALKCKGKKVKTNFDVSKYSELLQYMDTISLEELVMAVRRQSQGFARGSSKYRGVTRHPNGRWEARIGMPGSRHIYLGLYNDEAEAAKSYDRALVKLRGSQAATNFALSNYNAQLKEYHTAQQKEILLKSKQKKAAGAGAVKPSQIHYPNSPAALAEHAARCI